MKQVEGPRNGRGTKSALKQANLKPSKSGKRNSIKVPESLNGAKPATIPLRIEAKLVTLVKEAPGGDEWLHEIKFDGYRMFCRIDLGTVRIFSRNQKDWTLQLAPLVTAAAALPIDQAILDGELVAFKENGVSDFQSLQNAFSDGRVTVRNIMDRVNSLKKDPWAKIEAVRQTLTVKMKKTVGFQARG